MNEFALAMYLIQGVVSGKFTSIPTFIPSHIREKILGKPVSGKSVDLSPPIPAPTMSAKIDVKSLIDPIILPTKSLLAEKPLPVMGNPFRDDWDVTPSEKALADQDFDILDSEKQGFVEGDTVAKFMLKFKLSPEDLAHIWFVAILFNEVST